VRPKKEHALSEKIIAILVLAISLGVLAFGGILAANYTSANWLQLLYMTSPLLVALLARAVLKIPIEPALWPSLVLTLLGSGVHSTCWCLPLFRLDMIPGCNRAVHTNNA
jgi:drug/metabolite transporter (DMT)-like permease